MTLPGRTFLSGTCGPAPTYHWPGYPQCPGKEGSVNVRLIVSGLDRSKAFSQAFDKFSEIHTAVFLCLSRGKDALTLFYLINTLVTTLKQIYIWDLFYSPLSVLVPFDWASTPDCSQTHLWETEREKTHLSIKCDEYMAPSGAVEFNELSSKFRNSWVKMA